MSLIPFQISKDKRQKAKVRFNILTLLCAIAAFLAAPQAPFAATKSTISQWGVTWTFNTAHEAGQFVNGDWWVVGPVTITSISPNPGGGHNGTMINPVIGPGLNVSKEPDTKQGFDMGGTQYSASLMKIPPFNVPINSSVVSTISDLSHSGESKTQGWLKSASILTVLDSPPPANSFRPQYMAGEKKFYSANSLRRDLLLSLPRLGSAKSLTELEKRVARPWLMFLHGFKARAIHPSDYMRGYGANVVKEVSEIALGLLLDDPLAAKEDLLVGFTQVGIDLWGIFKAGNYWPSRGGHNSGRKWPIVFAATMLDDAEMKTIGTMSWTGHYEKGDLINWNAHGAFQEDCNVHYINGKFDYDGGYCYKGAHTTAIESYQKCCNSRPWIGQILSARLIQGAMQVWNWPALFEYQDWWVKTQCIADNWGGKCGGYGSSFSEDMWVAYRDKAVTSTATVGFYGTPQNGKPPLSVSFTNTSTSDYTSFVWDFGDGATSTQKNPVHSYTSEGLFTVTLTGTGSKGTDSKVLKDYITASLLDKITIEAEAMTLSNGYTIDNGAKLSGTAIVMDINLPVPSTGTATTAFNGSAGTYNITLSTVPENDGQPTVKLYVNSTLHINEILPTDWSFNAYTYREDYTVSGIALKPGDVLKIEGTSDNVTGFAGARIDKIILNPVVTSITLNRDTDVVGGRLSSVPLLEIYPNPVSALVEIKLGIKHADLVQVLVRNVRGEEVFRQASLSSSNGTVNLNMDNLENGIYVIKVQTNGTSVTREMMIVK